jgi:hypothetical protein
MRFKRLSEQQKKTNFITDLPTGEYITKINQVEERGHQKTVLVLTIIEGPHSGKRVAKWFTGPMAENYKRTVLDNFGIHSSDLKSMINMYAFATITSDSRGWVKDLEKAIPEGPNLNDDPFSQDNDEMPF